MGGNCDYMYLGFSTHPWLYHLPDYSEQPEKIEDKREEDVITKEIFLKTLDPICKFCRGKILRNQLLVMNPNIYGISYHAMCTTGYVGLDSVNFLKKENNFNGKYSRFYAAIVSIFENTERFINLAEPMIVIELQRQGFNTNHVNSNESMWKTIIALPHIVWWRESTVSGNHIWAIHRKHYGKIGDVDWKSYILEIMKAQRKGTLTANKLAYVTPKSLLQFILWKNSSFENALSKIEDVQFFQSDSKMLCVRLKNRADRNNGLAYSQKPFDRCGMEVQLSDDEENHLTSWNETKY